MMKESEIFYRPLPEVLKNEILGIDMDGVLSFSVEPAIQKFNGDFNTDYGVEDHYGWHTIKRLAEKHWSQRRSSVEAESPSEYDMWVWTHPDVLFQAPPVRGACEFTKAITEAGLDYYIITSRIPSLRESTFSWFETNMPWIDRSKIRINGNPDIKGEDYKHKTVAKEGVSLHFEDSLRHAKLITENTPASVVLLANWDLKDNSDYSHPRVFQVKRSNHRLTDMRDVHKKLIFDRDFLNVAQS